MVELPGAVGSFGARLVAQIAGADPRTIETATTDCDVLLFSVHFPGQLVYLKKAFEKLRLHPLAAKRKGPFVVFGGYGCNNPEPVSRIADRVVVGDGEGVAAALRDGADLRAGDIDGLPGVVVPDRDDATWGHRAQRGCVAAESGATLGGDVVLSRFDGSDHLPTVELARGCRIRCAFCAIGNTKAYRELPLDGAHRAAKCAKRLFAADLGSLSYYDGEDWLTTTAGGLSVKAALRKPSAIANLSQPTMGVEGWSERLRRMVGKPIDDDDLLRVAKIRTDAGKHIVLWYMMHSLPTSGPTDRLAFVQLLNKLPKGFTLKLSFTPAQKQPGTPLAYSPMWFDDAEATFVKRIRAECVTAAKKVLFVGKGPVKHYVDTLAACGTQRVADLFLSYGESLLNWPLPKLRAAARHYGNDLDVICAEWPETKDLPWGYVDFGLGDPRERYERQIMPQLV